MKKIMVLVLLLSATAFGYSVTPEEFLARDRAAIMMSPYLYGISNQISVKYIGSDPQGNTLFRIQNGMYVTDLQVIHEQIPDTAGNGMLKRSVVLLKLTTSFSNSNTRDIPRCTPPERLFCRTGCGCYCATTAFCTR